ncbi:Zn(2)-C6 fungal-type DNA-binding domain protein [Kalmanozyma brasiliensis GHG001]|uniref:Zn(2)-C6 fungal-type DNA-binding domain protein n=1 Tax=Kalmanozyma brasiliensis (strain GHG001) TaxID=1365824 RepID=UPI001CE9CF53|nr:Zn(2)-C6 fungal-type DNA-binding domain protein [Kalmanozyma brasiliensis GHG001]EST04814.2 Zn(2)-C6 fungal-type DNA-binding domain protein [Kalmanozyma brasiliensis GHG001]
MAKRPPAGHPPASSSTSIPAHHGNRSSSSTSSAAPSPTSAATYYSDRSRRPPSSSSASDLTLPPLHTALGSSSLPRGSALPPPLLPPTSSSSRYESSSNQPAGRPTSPYKPFVTPSHLIHGGRVTIPTNSSRPQPPPPLATNVPANAHDRRSASMTSNPDDIAASSNGAEAASTDAAKKKSTKKAVSCEACRRRKLKCDRGWPCGACRDRGESSKCEWAEGVRPQNTGRDTGDSSQINDRLDRLEAMMGAIAGSLGVDLPGAKSSPSTANGVAQRKLSSVSVNSANAASTSKLSTLAELGAVEASKAAALATTSPPKNETPRPYYSSGSVSWGFGFGFSQMNQVSSEEITRTTFYELLNLLPDKTIIQGLTDFYFRELSWMAYLIPEEAFRKRQRAVEEVRLYWDGRPDAMPYAEMRDSLRLVSTIHALCGAALVFGEPKEAEDLPEKYGKQAFTIFLDAAQHALTVLDIYEELHVDNVRTMVLLSSCMSALKGPAVGAAMMANICFMAYALQLDVEPSETLPLDERKDRIGLFATLCISDWFSAGNVKRSYIIDPANTSMPSLFGPDAHNSELVSTHLQYKLKLSDVARRASHRIRMSEDEAYEFTKQLHQEVVAIEASIPEHLRFDDSLIDLQDSDNQETWQRSAMALAVQMQLLTLHKRFYVQSWSNPKYKESRDISFAASMLIIKVFRNAFKWFTPRENATIDEQRAMIGEGMRTQHKSVSRLWFFAQMSIIASLVLIHFVSMLDTHPQESCDWDSSELRAQITDDLKFVRLLLQALSSKSKLAMDGARAIQPPESNRNKRKADDALMGPSHGPGPTRGGGPLSSRSADSALICNPSHHSTSSAYSSGSTPAMTHAHRTSPAYNSPGSSSTSSHSLSHSASASELMRPKLPFDGSMAPANANSFDDIEALWQKQPWQTASLRMGTSPGVSPSFAGGAGKARSASGTSHSFGSNGAHNGSSSYFPGKQPGQGDAVAASGIPGLAGNTTTNGDTNGSNPDCPLICASFFGPDASFNDIARAEAAIGRQDASYGYPVAPLSPFTASFINSLDQYVASLEEPLPSGSASAVPIPVTGVSMAVPQSHAMAQAAAMATSNGSTGSR